MNLLIVESPGKIKKIRSILPEGWNIAASVGHVRDLPQNEKGVSPPNFVPHYVLTERGQRVINDLQKLVQEATQVYLATDPDREGEAIAWHLAESLKLNDPWRVTYTEITKTAIQKAISSPRHIDMNLVRAQEGRRVLDRLFGYNVSPALHTISGQNLTAGRVQSPALRLVVEREKAIRAFTSVTHYGVDLYFNGKKGAPGAFFASWNTRDFLKEGENHILDKGLAERVASLTKVTVASYHEGELKVSPPPPFITSTLQQAASNALKLNPQKTMEIAQRLYETGHITYMRTDSPNLAQEALDAIIKVAKDHKWPLPEKPRVFQGRADAQEAHEAIRPTHPEVEIAGETPEEKSLYRLIRIRALASQLQEAIYSTTRATFTAFLDEKTVSFDAKGRLLKSPGFRVLLPKDDTKDTKDDDKEPEMNNPIPHLTVGEIWEPQEADLKTKKTLPPVRYTQASLIRDLEKRGIGRPSTYASILENISNRNYISENSKRQLEATPIGEKLITYLSGSFGFLEYDFTRNLEISLDDIALGKKEYLPVVKNANSILEGEISSFLTGKGAHPCPVCSSPLRHLKKDSLPGEKGYNYWKCTNDSCGSIFDNLADAPILSSRRQSFLTDFLCPICQNPLRHFIREESPNQKAYNFWRCTKDECMTSFENDGNTPNLNNPIPSGESSSLSCPACNAPLKHFIRDANEFNKGYNFWKCSNEKCSSFFADNNGAPDPESRNQSFITDEQCPFCSNVLKHNIKAPNAQGSGGYNYWICSDSNCRKKFTDVNGSPDFDTPYVNENDPKCPNCQEPLRHLFKDPSPEDKGYNYWKCYNTKCGRSFEDSHGKPDFNNYRQSIVTDFTCPTCGHNLRHLMRPDKPDLKGYNYWKCVDNSCGTTLEDLNGEPNFDTVRNVASDYTCTLCGTYLIHITSNPGSPKPYNYWKCKGDDCGAFYDDSEDKPDFDSLRTSKLTKIICPKCSGLLKHNVRDGSANLNAYNYWACTNQDCKARYKDNLGTPGDEIKTMVVYSNYLCPDCGLPMIHRVKEEDSNVRGYNFWGCSGFPTCKTTCRDDNGKPGAKNPPRDQPSGFKCPRCDSDLIRRVGVSARTGNNYDFFTCANKECRFVCNTSNDRPDIPENVLKKLAEKQK
ncbi:MAG: type I DNA topoisomerase [Deltaproteobacteria bacterium]|jgi:DNA topoisomerase-1|nr:type I DNA topoisomerase [Deltaproteobacteria bacterium]